MAGKSIRLQSLEDVKRFFSAAEENYTRYAEDDEAYWVEHPINAYLTIKRFALNWYKLIHNTSLDQDALTKFMTVTDVQMAGPSDLRGAGEALIRIQQVYKLSTEGMYDGRILEYQGMPLSPADAYDIGTIALDNKDIEEGLSWLQTAVDREERASTDPPSFPLANAYGRLGYTYLTLQNIEKAQEYLEKGQQLDPYDDAVLQLQIHLRSGQFPSKPKKTSILDEFFDYEKWMRIFSRLCSRRETVRTLQRHHHCRYKCTTVPYKRYKEEIINLDFYVSVFYDVISDQEIEILKQLATSALYRGSVFHDGAHLKTELRTSDLTFLDDERHAFVAKLSKRVTEITGLDTTQRYPHGFDSAEGFQVVNYGMGGHYDGHLDPLSNDAVPVERFGSDNRLATFLFYLSDVPRGGRTVFTSMDIGVSPVKGSALFWYNYKPQGDIDYRTIHAGCPVVIGQKWIANKWIWHNGNTFRRPCPLSESGTQWTLEKQFNTTC